MIRVWKLTDLCLRSKSLLVYKDMLLQLCTLGLSTLLVRGASIICMPLVLACLMPAQYGMLALANSCCAILAAAMGLGLRQALPLYYFTFTHEQRLQLLMRVMCSYLLGAPCIALCAVMLCYIWLPTVICQYSAFIVVLLIGFCSFFIELAYQLLQYHQQVAALATLQVLQAAVTIGCTYLLLWTDSSWWIAPLVAQLIALTVVAAAIGWRHKLFLYSLLLCRPSWASMVGYMRVSVWFIPSMLFGWLLAATQRWLLARSVAMAAVGTYAVADSLSQLAYVVCTYAMAGSHMPYLLRQFAANPDHIVALEERNRMLMWFVMSGALCCLAAIHGWLVPWVALWIPVHFRAALHYVAPLCVGTVFVVGAYFLCPLVQHHKRHLFLGCCLAIPACVNVAVGMVLVPRYEVMGAVYAQIIAYATYFGMSLWYNQRLLKQLRNSSGS